MCVHVMPDVMRVYTASGKSAEEKECTADHDRTFQCELYSNVELLALVAWEQKRKSIPSSTMVNVEHPVLTQYHKVHIERSIRT